MPVLYQYVSKRTGKPERLTTVEDEICEVMHVQPDPDKYLYQEQIAIIGVNILLKFGGTEVTEKMLIEHLETKDYPDAWWELLWKFLVDDYTFTAWR